MSELVLEVGNVTRLFGRSAALVDVSFSIRDGEVFGLLGPNGAGKTTAISIISGLLEANAGGVSVFGHDMRRDSKAARRHIGVVPQELALYMDLTAFENLVFWGRLAGLGRQDAGDRANHLLGEVDLDKRANDRVRTFSGGMKRRVNIACALMHDPKLLLLDEPTVGVDPQAREHMIDWMKSWVRPGRAILYTTHYLDEAERLCDRIAIIDHGRILACASLEELVKSVDGHSLISLQGNFAALSQTQEVFLKSNFRVLRRNDEEMTVAPVSGGEAVDVMRDILNSDLQLQRVTLSKPGLHDVFLHLTGKDLRE